MIERFYQYGVSHLMSWLGSLAVLEFFINSGGPPPDGTPSKVIRTFKIGLVVTFYILASLGILFAIACLIFNIIFRSRK